MIKAEWYEDWFNSPFYHLLYNNRNHEEADFFTGNLCRKLDLKPQMRIWDLACGKGRHAISLYKKGFNVTGTDLAQNNISEALKFAGPELSFFVHDMREPFAEKKFDAVFNLFTSIGYFENYSDNFLVFQNVMASLRPGGVFVVDFFNSEKVAANFKSGYTERRNEIEFKIEKELCSNYIVKKITFKAGGHLYSFTENVSLLKKSDFESFALKAGFVPLHVFGNYRLDDFDASVSDRLILVFKKPG